MRSSSLPAVSPREHGQGKVRGRDWAATRHAISIDEDPLGFLMVAERLLLCLLIQIRCSRSTASPGRYLWSGWSICLNHPYPCLSTGERVWNAASLGKEMLRQSSRRALSLSPILRSTWVRSHRQARASPCASSARLRKQSILRLRLLTSPLRLASSSFSLMRTLLLVGCEPRPVPAAGAQSSI